MMLKILAEEALHRSAEYVTGVSVSLGQWYLNHRLPTPLLVPVEDQVEEPTEEVKVSKKKKRSRIVKDDLSDLV